MKITFKTVTIGVIAKGGKLKSMCARKGVHLDRLMVLGLVLRAVGMFMHIECEPIS